MSDFSISWRDRSEWLQAVKEGFGYAFGGLPLTLLLVFQAHVDPPYATGIGLGFGLLMSAYFRWAFKSQPRRRKQSRQRRTSDV